MVLASVACAVLSMVLIYLYGIVHWNIMIPQYFEQELPKSEKDVVLQVLGIIGFCYQSTALLSLVCAALSFKGKPRWASIIALILAAFVMFNAFLVIT